MMQPQRLSPQRRPLRRAALAATLLAGTSLGGFALGHNAWADNPTPVNPPGTQLQPHTLPDFTNLVTQVKPAVVSITNKLKPPRQRWKTTSRAVRCSSFRSRSTR